MRAANPRLRLALLAALCAIGLASAGVAAAQDQEGPAPAYTEIIIPTSGQDTASFPTLDKRAEYFAEGKIYDLSQYISVVYSFLISIAGVVASVMMIVGGFQYLTSAGDAGKIGAAKSRMSNALMGLLLALGAYTILRTINKDLVNLKPLTGVTSVKTELVTLPWCDEIAEGTPVNPIWGLPNSCGSVGEYMNGKTRLACLYRSACPNELGSEVPGVLRDSASKGALRATCVQTLTTSAYVNDPFTAEEVFNLAERDAKYDKWKADHPGERAPGGCGGKSDGGSYTDAECKQYNDWYKSTIYSAPSPYPPMQPRPASLLSGKVQFFARCMSCITYGAVEKAPQSNPEDGSDYVYQPPHEGRCAYWQSEANGGIALTPETWTKRKAAGTPLISYCHWMSDERGCAQTDFACHEPISDNGCGAYDNIKPFYMFDMVRGGYVWWEYGGGKMGTISARPDVLQDICFANPCGYNVAKGCTGSSGIVDGIRTAAAAVRDGIIGIQECVNK